MDLVEKYLGEVVSSKLLAKMVRNVDKSKKKRKEKNAKSNKKLIGKFLGNMTEAKSWGGAMARKHGSTQMECMECGNKFKKKLGKNTVEVKCPKCKGYDTNVAGF